MKKIALLMMLILCAVSSLPLVVQAQSEVAEQRRAEISRPIHFDKTTKPLREMFDTGEPAKPARATRRHTRIPEPPSGTRPASISCRASRRQPGCAGGSRLFGRRSDPT